MYQRIPWLKVFQPGRHPGHWTRDELLWAQEADASPIVVLFRELSGVPSYFNTYISHCLSWHVQRLFRKKQQCDGNWTWHRSRTVLEAEQFVAQKAFSCALSQLYFECYVLRSKLPYTIMQAVTNMNYVYAANHKAGYMLMDQLICAVFRRKDLSQCVCSSLK